MSFTHLPLSSGSGANQPANIPSSSRLPTPEQSPQLHRTHSQANEDDDDENTAPANVLPARKRRKKNGIASQTDAEVWPLNDAEILQASKATWKSAAYDHYNISLERNDATRRMTFKFKCKYNHLPHEAVTRARESTSNGTSSLLRTAQQCDSDRGIVAEARATGPSYSVAAHRTLIAMRTATSNRPFNAVNDKYYRMEVEMLRPGTSLPAASTVSRDLNLLYLELSKDVRSYFKKRDRPVHGQIDGWTSPLGPSWLGIVISWADAGAMHRAVLEFVKLTQSHTGDYLGQVFVECLERFGLEQLLLFLNMDNAGNCDTTAVRAGELMSTFRGAEARLRCILHILNLAAKAFIQFFFKELKRRKAITVKGRKRVTNAVASSSRTPSTRTNARPSRAVAPTPSIEEEAVAQEGEDLSPEEEELAAVLDAKDDDATGVVDASQEIHDTHTARSIRAKAVAFMAALGVEIDELDDKMALAIFPKVAGLAKKVHDSGTIADVFQSLLDTAKAAGKVHSDKTALARRVPTRWNSDFACLNTHITLKYAVQQLTATSELKLSAFKLTNAQWELAEEVSDVLSLFDDMTLHFSQAETPLIADTIGALEDLLTSLKMVRDDTEASNVVRVAACASVMVTEKYFSLTEECEVYSIAIVMSPDKKLEWFRQRQWSEEDIARIKERVVSRWQTSYKSYSISPLPGPVSASQPTAASARAARWRVATPAVIVVAGSDTIEAYLAEAPIASDMLAALGGPIGYWFRQEQLKPSLARMGTDYCSAPATSVDTERSFSDGRRKLGFMQHNTADQTFRSSMAVGSWDGTPLFPDISKAVQILQKSMERGGND